MSEILRTISSATKETRTSFGYSGDEPVILEPRRVAEFATSLAEVHVPLHTELGLTSEEPEVTVLIKDQPIGIFRWDDDSKKMIEVTR